MPLGHEYSRLAIRMLELAREVNTLVVGATAADLEGIISVLASTLAHATARLAEERTRHFFGQVDPNKCLTMAEASKVTGVLENTLREAGRRGTLPVVQIGRYVYVRLASLGQWIAEHETRRRRSS